MIYGYCGEGEVNTVGFNRVLWRFTLHFNEDTPGEEETGRWVENS